MLVICIIKRDINVLKLIFYVFLQDLLHYGVKENLIAIIKLIFGCIFIVNIIIFLPLFCFCILIRSKNNRNFNIGLSLLS